MINHINTVVRSKLRSWLLTEDERNILEEVRENSSRISENRKKVKEVRSEWVELQRALEKAEIVGEHKIESADILVLTGRQHSVRGAEFGDGMYINGREHVIDSCTIKMDERI